MTQTEIDTGVPVDELYSGLADIKAVLTRFCKGDTAQRAVVSSEKNILNDLKILVNQLADHIEETSDYAHDMAIGLCGHYDTLNRIAVGDFSARAAEDSENELVAKLGELINRESATLTGAIDLAKKAEIDAKDAYQQMLDIIEFLPDATFVVDKEQRVIAWNRAIENMTGMKKEDVMGKGDHIYSIPFYGECRPILIDLIDEDLDIISRQYTAIKMDGRTLFAETYVPSFRNGDSRYFWGAATPLFDKQGNQVGGIQSIRDITEYRRAALEKSRVEAQLHHAKMMKLFMARLGHDLKTPLTPLFVLLPLLKKQLADPGMIKKVEMCIKSAASINDLAGKARTLASLLSIVTPQDQVPISLASIVDNSLAGCLNLISEKQIECRNVVDPAVVVHVVPDQISVLFANLISNAAQFSHDKGTVVISAERHGEVVAVSVQDEGVGLAPDHLNHVFDELFKVDESRHDINTSGLGLSICKQIVQNHHGRIWAESPGIGKGTTIKFTINEHAADCGYDAKESE